MICVSVLRVCIVDDNSFRTSLFAALDAFLVKIPALRLVAKPDTFEGILWGAYLLAYVFFLFLVDFLMG